MATFNELLSETSQRKGWNTREASKVAISTNSDLQDGALGALAARVRNHPRLAQQPNLVDPSVLKRCLVARRHNVNAAYKLWETWAEWRTSFKPERLTFEDVQAEYEATRKATIEGQDKHGRPCVVVRIRGHRIGQFPIEDSMNLSIYTLETGTTGSRQQADGYVVSIIDCAGVGFQNLCYKFVLKKPGLLTVMQNYYPEVLRKLFFVNTNAIFRAFFKCCLPFIDENVRSKIVFVQKPHDLLEHFHPHELPHEFQHMCKPDGSESMVEEAKIAM